MLTETKNKLKTHMAEMVRMVEEHGAKRGKGYLAKKFRDRFDLKDAEATQILGVLSWEGAIDCSMGKTPEGHPKLVYTVPVLETEPVIDESDPPVPDETNVSPETEPLPLQDYREKVAEVLAKYRNGHEELDMRKWDDLSALDEGYVKWCGDRHAEELREQSIVSVNERYMRFLVQEKEDFRQAVADLANNDEHGTEEVPE